MVDSSSRYIKMCDNAHIQKKWKRLKCDIFAFGKIAFSEYTIRTVDGSEYTGILDKEIWLPRLDQLPYLTGYETANKFVTPFEIHEAFSDYIKEMSKEYLSQFDTLEQLWLSFVMFNNERMIWDDEFDYWWVMPIV